MKLYPHRPLAQEFKRQVTTLVTKGELTNMVTVLEASYTGRARQENTLLLLSSVDFQVQ